MKTRSKNILACLFLLVAVQLTSCQKDNIIPGGAKVAKVNVINTISNNGYAKVIVSATDMSWASLPENQYLGGWNFSKMFMLPTDKTAILKVASFSDTTKLWYNNRVKLEEGRVYSLYLSGTPTAVDTMFREVPDFPNYILQDPGKSLPSADSIVNIRFVNLSPSGPKVDINIQGQSATEASNLGYQKVTNFKAYPATTGVYSIVFEVRRSSDKQLITTYDFNVDYSRFQSLDVVIVGIYDPGNLLNLPYLDQYHMESIPY